MNSFICLSSMPVTYRPCSFVWIPSLIKGVMSDNNNSYTVVSERCLRPSSMYWSLSRTTIVEPLSVLFITM